MSGRIQESHRQQNLSTRDKYIQFTEHRDHVMQLLLAAGYSSTDRVAIIGAGNCNELRLQELLATYAHVHLVDLDSGSLLHATREIETQRLSIQGDLDISGILPKLDAITPDTANDDLVQQLLEASRASHIKIDHAPFDIVVSTCLLTQLFHSLVMAFGEQYARLNELIFEVRRKHLHLMIESLAPGGRGLLITDFVASATYPNLMNIPAEQFADAMTEALIADNFFTGANPLAIMKRLQEDPEFANTTHHNVTLPWRWNIGQKQFAVAAVQFLRS